MDYTQGDHTQCKKFTVICSGMTEEDVTRAFEEAVQKIRAGYRLGTNGDGDSAFVFRTTTDVPEDEWPG